MFIGWLVELLQKEFLKCQEFVYDFTFYIRISFINLDSPKIKQAQI